MVAWRLGILQELSLAGVRVEPDPFRLEAVWNPARMLLRLRSAGLPLVPFYLGESLDAAVEFAQEGPCVQRAAHGEVEPVLNRLEPGEELPVRLAELWESSSEGPFLLLRPPEGLYLTVLCLTGEALGAVSWNLESPQGRGTPKAKLQDREFELAAKVAALFGLSVCGVDLVRTEAGTFVLGVRSQGVLEAFAQGHPRFGEWIPEALERMFAIQAQTSSSEAP